MSAAEYVVTIPLEDLHWHHPRADYTRRCERCGTAVVLMPSSLRYLSDHTARVVCCFCGAAIAKEECACSKSQF